MPSPFPGDLWSPDGRAGGTECPVGQRSEVSFRFSMSREQKARKMVEGREGERERSTEHGVEGGGRQKRVPTFCEGYKKSSRLGGHPTI